LAAATAPNIFRLELDYHAKEKIWNDSRDLQPLQTEHAATGASHITSLPLYLSASPIAATRLAGFSDGD